jgi:hypothetical protein
VPRLKISLDGSWDFFPDPQMNLQAGALDRVAPRRIRVPGPWQAQFDDLRHYSGAAWYRRSFEWPLADALPRDLDYTFVLAFGAVDYFASVWLNGQFVGEHEGGYLPFEFNVDGALRRRGLNELVVRVLDSGGGSGQSSEFPFAEIPHGKQSWYGPVGGIWQTVSLEARHVTHFTRLHVTPDVAGERARVSVRLNRKTDRECALRFTLTDPLGQHAAHYFALSGGADSFEAALPVARPMLWDTQSPFLYRLEASLLEGGATVGRALDSVSSHFGMRTIATSEDGHLKLNDRVLYLRGALDQDYYPEMIYTPFGDAELEEQFRRAKHMGLNCLRTHIKITDPRYYDAADRAGLLIWTELPNWENLTAAAKERIRATLDGMVERDWNHPSIIIWTIVNEGWGVDLAVNAEHRRWLRESYEYMKQRDPHRLVVGNSACFTNFHVVTDIEDFHNYYAIPDHYRKWREWVETFAARPAWSFAHDYESIEAWRQFLKDPWNPAPRTPAPEVRRTGREPMVVSEFGNWGLPDVETLKQCYGGREPWWFETGIEWEGGAVYPHACEERFRLYHLDQVFPTFGHLARASQRMQYCALKYQIEQMRLHPSIVGYVITEFTDVHWEANGLLDICRNPKAYYDAIGDINNADVVVPEWERVSYWEGERCEVGLTLSHFSALDLGGASLEWFLDVQPEIRGRIENLRPAKAQITRLGAVAFTVPQVTESVRARLELRLYDAGGAVVTSNHHELYFFPRAAGAPVNVRLSAPPALGESLRALGYDVAAEAGAADLIVTDRLTDELRAYLQNGGRVLWLAESEESQQTYLGRVEIAARKGRRWQGDWASNFNWVRQDRLFSRIPTNGMVDFAFADLTPDHVISGLQPREFASDVHAGIFVGWVHHVAALVAERRFGQGRLLISTFRLGERLLSQPVAAIMVRDLIAELAVARASA